MPRLAFVCLALAWAASAVAQPVPGPEVGAPEVRVVAQDAASVTVEVVADWDRPLAQDLAASGSSPEAVASVAAAGQPVVSHLVDLLAAVPPAVTVLDADTEAVTVSGATAEALRGLERPLAAVENVGEYRRRLVGTLAVAVLRLEGDRLIRARRVRVRVPRPVVNARLASRGDDNPHLAVAQSQLASGTWFKVPVAEAGVYRIDAAYLADSLGVEGVSIEAVQVYGNGGRPLPALNSAPRPADLVEVPTLVRDGALLFYAEGTSWWDWDASAETWRHDINPFTDASHYFLRVDTPAPRRLGDAAFPNWPDAVALDRIEDRHFYEEDFTNIERDDSGSGLDWLGPLLPRGGTGRTVLDVSPPGLASATPIRYRARVAAQANPRVTITMTHEGQTVDAVSPPAGNFSSANTGNLAREASLSGTVTGASTLAVTISTSGGNTAAASWLDWVEALFERPAEADGGFLAFPTPGGQTGRFEVSLGGFTSAPEVWDVTESGAIRRLGVQAAGGRFRTQVEATDPERPREIIAFDPSGPAVGTLAAGAPVPVQNLHGLADHPEYVVVSHPSFLSQAQRLADYRAQRDGLRTLVVTTEAVYNEFASGTADMRAVRDFMKFLYDRAPDAARLPRYLVLFGDGHYDFRGIEASEPNYVLPFQSDNMLSRTLSYTSDDYFGLLGDDEGVWSSGTRDERVDIGIGRIPARTIRDATSVVSKVIRYEDPATRGAWRTRHTFIGDDQLPNSWDRDLHVFNADGTADRTLETDSTVTLQKIYGPAFPIVNTARGLLRPQAQEAILNAVEQGTLIFNYSGHGGPEGLGGEGYVTPEVVQAFDNEDRYPIFVTATCSFGKFDIADTQSLAEEVLLRERGGSVAMLTTVRLVYTSSSPTDGNNYALNLELTRQLLTREADGRPTRLGDALRRTKQSAVGSSFNNRKFNLLGDPALRIGLPERRVAVSATPTLRAFEEATVTGQVLTLDGAPDASYTGEVEVQVFDAERTIELPEAASQFTGGQYRDRTDQIYRGRASVTGGQFSATFRVPQDVSYSGQSARVVVYALGADGSDGAGQTEDVVVSAEAGARPNDVEGPEIRLFLNDSTFVDGGTTPPGGLLIARLADESGINTVGAGVGHELLLTIDDDAASAIDVGPFYAGDLDTYRSGEVRVALPDDIEPGEHTLRLTAWDALNNPSSAELRFVVVEEDLSVENLFPYPNPTAGPTRFVFDHNLRAGTPARLQLRIYTLAGRPVRTLDGDEALPGGVLTPSSVQIPWDGVDDDGDRLATGVYLFRLRMEVDDPAGGSRVVERVERLAIIR
ncbi:MAG: type IX secretion system sortase PorU [Bacteroidota bacterium]